MGRLDRAVANAVWFHTFPQAWVDYIITGTSDHSPLVLHWDVIAIWGPCAFKHFNSWTAMEGYQESVSMAWKCDKVGFAQFLLAQKLKQVKCKLKEWQLVQKNKRNMNIIGTKDELWAIQNQLQINPLHAEWIAKEKEALERLGALFAKEEQLKSEKARLNWLNMGDRCTKLFHQSMKFRPASKYIDRMKDEQGFILEDLKLVQSRIVQFYDSFFHKSSLKSFFQESFLLLVLNGYVKI